MAVRRVRLLLNVLLVAAGIVLALPGAAPPAFAKKVVAGSFVDVQVGDSPNKVSRVVVICSTKCSVEDATLIEGPTQVIFLTGVKGRMAVDTTNRSSFIEEVSLRPIQAGSILTLKTLQPARGVTVAPCGDNFKICIDLTSYRTARPPHAAITRRQKAPSSPQSKAPTHLIPDRYFATDVKPSEKTALTQKGLADKGLGATISAQKANTSFAKPAVTARRADLSTAATVVRAIKPVDNELEAILDDLARRGGQELVIANRAKPQKSGELPYKDVLQDFVAVPLTRDFCAVQRARLQADAWDMVAHKNVAICKAAAGASEEADGLIARQLRWDPEDTELLKLRSVFAAMSRPPKLAP